MTRIELRPQKTALLRRGGDEQDRTTGRLCKRGECLGDFEKRCHARGIIDGAMVDLIVLAARQLAIPPEMVPMGGIDHVLVLVLRVGPRSEERRVGKEC